MRNLTELEIISVSGGNPSLRAAAIGGTIGAVIGSLTGLASTFTYYEIPLPEENLLGYVLDVTGITHAIALACTLDGLITGAKMGIIAGIILTF